MKINVWYATNLKKMEFRNISVLFENFNWHKCPDGYEIVDRQVGTKGQVAHELLSGKFIRPLSSRKESYRPKKFKTLHRILADKVNTDEEVLAFSNRFGFLYEFDEQPIKTPLLQSKNLRKILKLLDQDNLDDAVKIYNAEIVANMTAKITQAVSKKGSSSFEINPVPKTLLGYIWLSVAVEITQGRSFVRCKNCEEYIFIGKNGRTKRAEYCSDSCRVNSNRK